MNEDIIGLDIATTAVRGVKLRSGERRPVLLQFGQVGLRVGAVQDGEVVRPDEVVRALQRLWRDAEFETKRVVLGISGSRSIVRELTLPWMPEKEVPTAARFQAADIIPFPPDKTVLGIRAAGETVDENGRRLRRALVLAMHREVVDNLVGVASDAGLDVVGLDMVPLAILRVLGDGSGENQGFEALVSIGAGQSHVVIHQNGALHFVRTIPIGGNAFTEALAQALGVPMADAEQIKRRLMIGKEEHSFALEALKAPISDLCREILASLEYATQSGAVQVSRVVVMGGGSLVAGFMERLQGLLDIPVERVSLFSHLDVSLLQTEEAQLRHVEPFLVSPAGLALCPLDPIDKGGANLLPKELIHLGRVRRATSTSQRVAALCVVGVVALGGWFTWRSHTESQQVANTKATVAEIQRQLPTYSPALAVANAVSAAVGRVVRLTSQVPDWWSVLQQLANENPDGLQLGNLSGDTTTLADSTTSSSGSSPPQGNLPAPVSAQGGGSAAKSGIPGAKGATPTQLGTLQLQAAGTYPGDVTCSPYAAFIGAFGPPFFGPPQSSGPSCPFNGSSTTVSFGATLPVLSKASLAANGCYDLAHEPPACTDEKSSRS